MVAARNICLCLVCLLFIAAGKPVVIGEKEFGQTYSENIEAIGRLYAYVIALPQQEAFAVIDTIRREALSGRNKDWQMEAELLRAYYLEQDKTTPLDIKIDRMKNVAAEARKRGVYHVYARALHQVAVLYWSHQIDYELAFEQYLLLEDFLKTIDPADFPDKAGYLARIGEAYYFFGDYKRAADIFRQAVQIPVTEFNANAINTAANTLGLAYQNMGMPDSAARYFRQISGNKKTALYPLWEGIASGNLGFNEYLLKNYEKAIPLLEKDFSTAIQYRDYGLASGSGTVLADIYLAKGQIPQARFYMDSAYALIRESGQTDRLRKLYPVMSKYYSLTGDAGNALRYMDSTLQTKDRYHEKYNALLLLRVEQKEQQKKREALLAEQQRIKLIRNAIILALAAAFVFLATLYQQSLKRNKIKEALKNLELQKADEELRSAREQLSQFRKKLTQNRLISESIREENSERGESLARLAQSTILTEEDWVQFKYQFDKVHQGYLDRLAIEYPFLTQGEIRYLSLVKLGMPPKEIAFALGVSPASLRVTWHRIRRKAGLEKDCTAESFLTGFEAGPSVPQPAFS